ncbi:hypothetical protein HPB49_003476 [Dermacentor silvarum]|uniref:Uncharacterized protein n=1 Tax=Dermacentor silvarum TaxID=543639 RepID=A0ACB8DMG1_DERSI|nr:hypothetical protein HPB49_003476 [Dermacentor silvarum]
MQSSIMAPSSVALGRAKSIAPPGYRFILPDFPEGELMKDSLVLHCDPTGRPYRFEDFLRPLEELGLLECVAGFGGFQFNHVWLLRLSTSADRRVLLEAGRITVKDKHCAVVDPCRREVCAKVHWVPFSVTDDALKEAFNDYGLTEPKREGNVNAAAQAEASGNTKTVQVARPQPLNEATPLVKPCLGQGTSTERLEATTAKRRREYGNDAITEQRLRQLERQWVLAPGRRIMCASNGRSPSCSRGGGRFSL